MSSPWLWRVRAVERPVARLLCLPHAGGGASVFGGWLPLLPGDVELLAVQLPGRENRITEPAPDDLDALLGTLAGELRAAAGRAAPAPLVLFGHSWGAVLGYELARRLPAVAHLVVSAARAPHLLALRATAHLPRAELLAELAAMGGIHPEVLARGEYVDLVLPTLRADLRLAESYRPRDAAPLPVPITVFAGTDDALTPEPSVRDWSRYTSGTFAVRRFPGGHFFFVEQRESVVAAIAEIVASTRTDLAGAGG